MVLPLMLAGAWTAVARWRDHPAARTLLVLVLVYPAGDLVSRYRACIRSAARRASVRSFCSRRWAPLHCGTCSRSGRADGGRRWRWWRAARRCSHTRASWCATSATSIATRRSISPTTKISCEAMRWLKPRLGRYDAVFCTVQGTNEAFSIALVGLEYDPAPLVLGAARLVPMERVGGHLALRENVVHVRQCLARRGRSASRRRARQEHVLFIVRPGELDLPAPIETIRGPDGSPMLLLCERDL